jgi:hypothetical protein
MICSKKKTGFSKMEKRPSFKFHHFLKSTSLLFLNAATESTSNFILP